MPYFIKNNLVLFLFICCFYSLGGQNFPSININASNGLPNNQVEAILKDSRGIIWVGTNNGLAKIENEKITNFFKEDGLAHNSIWSIIEDTNNNLWFGTFGGGLTLYDGKKFRIFDIKDGLVNNSVRKLSQFKNHILAGTQNGLSIINLDNYQVENIDTNIEGFQVMDFFTYKEDIYCGTFKKGIFKIDISKMTVEKVFDYDEKGPNSALFSIHIEDNLLYYSIDGANNYLAKGAIRKFNIENLLKNKEEDTIFGKSIFWDYAKDSKGNLYGAAWGVHGNNGGLFEIENNSIIDRTSDFGITSLNVRCLFYDKEFNVLYAGTTDTGFFKIDLDRTVLYYKTDQIKIIDIDAFGETLYLLYQNGLSIGSDGQILKKVSNSEFLKEAKNLTNEVRSIINNDPNKIAFRKVLYNKDFIWISTNIGLFKLSPEGQILSYYDISTSQFEFDNEGLLLNPLPYTSLLLFNNLEKLVNKEYDGSDINTPVNVSSYAKFEDRIYISTEYKGLFVYENRIFTSLNQLGEFDQLEIKHLASISEKDILIIATSSGETYLVDVNNGFNIIKKFKRETIIGNSILFLETYQKGILVGTEKGLNVFYYDNDRFQFIDEEQGFIDKEFNSSKIVKNNLFIGTNTGYYSVNLNHLFNQKSKNLKAILTDITINHKKDTLISNYWFKINNNEFKFQYDENVIDLNFSCSNHPYPKKLLYSYQVEGLDSTWSKYSNSSKIYIQYLPEGNYKVNVNIKDLSTGSISHSKLATISILPPFWKTWWFISLLLFSVFIIAIIAYKNRIRFIKKREQQKAKIQQRLVETKLEALQSQMNPHFTFNAMNSIQNYIIDNDIDNALMYLSEFAKLIRKTLDNSSKHLILLAEEISYLKSYIALENMRFNNKVNITIDYESLEPNNIELPPMIVQPFVENAFVHAYSKDQINPKLRIRFYINDQQLICEIEDNGKGLTETASGQIHQSKGINLVLERLKLLNKNNNNSFNITSKKDMGTKVVLCFELLLIND